jgi:hypothetical protein
MLHLCGEDAIAIWLQGARPDDGILVWHERLTVGPAPAALTPDGWLNVRATALATLDGADPAREHSRLVRQYQQLEAALQQDEIVIWSGTSVDSQLHLVQLLSWFSRPLFLRAQLSIADSGCDTVDTALDQRLTLGLPHLRLGDVAWRAFRADDPIGLEAIAAVGDAHGLTGLTAAYRRLLREFPSANNGLSRSERLVFMALEAGANAFDDIHRHMHDLEPVPFLDRLTLRHLLNALAGGANPLLALVGDVAEPECTPTETGLAVAGFNSDALELRGVNRWIGGVHIRAPNHIWRFDNRRGRLLRLHSTAPQR